MARITMTQQQRREATNARLIEVATKKFGERGFAKTSLEDIASSCGLTIGAIYNNFGNKKLLFLAVVEKLEQEIVDKRKLLPRQKNPLEQITAAWEMFLDLCAEPGFRRILIEDGPTILGHDRWTDTAVIRGNYLGLKGYRSQELLERIFLGAFKEIALYIAGSDNPDDARREAMQIVRELARGFFPSLEKRKVQDHTSNNDDS